LGEGNGNGPQGAQAKDGEETGGADD